MEAQITYEDGTTVTAKIKLSDLVAFERHFKVSWGTVEDNPKVEHSLYLAWHALKRSNAGIADFEAWLDTVEGMDTDEEPGKAPPKPNRSQRRSRS